MPWDKCFLLNCEQVKEEYDWASPLMQVVVGHTASNGKYLHEMRGIKEQVIMRQVHSEEPINSEVELNTFKRNLKKSVLLSLRQTQPDSRMGNSKIATAINPRRYSRISIERMPRVKQGNPRDVQNSSCSKEGLRKSIISFVDDTLSSVIGTDLSISKQHAHDLELFLRFSTILERHLGDKGCVLGRVKFAFISYVEGAFGDAEQAGEHIEDLVDSVKQFLVILREGVIDYYQLESLEDNPNHQNPFICNEENVLSACTAILFKDPLFYQVVFRAINMHCRQREEEFAQVLDMLGHKPPEFFQVKDRFCLNERSIRGYVTGLGRESQGFSIEEVTIETESRQFEPFDECVQYLLELSKTRSPINKMKAIMSCSENISTEIENFYEREGMVREKWVLDADQVLSIFCYIISRARVEHLHSHLFAL